MKNAFCYLSRIGNIWIVEEDESIIGISFTKRVIEDYTYKETKLIKETYRQLSEYFEGTRREFDINIKLIGTPFQLQVWDQLLKIPYGKTVSYKWVAENIQHPNAYRAVGMANNRNPISIIVPCHRVIGQDGSLVGYGGGLDIKRELLTLECENERQLLDSLN